MTLAIAQLQVRVIFIEFKGQNSGFHGFRILLCDFFWVIAAAGNFFFLGSHGFSQIDRPTQSKPTFKDWSKCTLVFFVIFFTVPFKINCVQFSGDLAQEWVSSLISMGKSGFNEEKSKLGLLLSRKWVQNYCVWRFWVVVAPGFLLSVSCFRHIKQLKINKKLWNMNIMESSKFNVDTRAWDTWSQEYFASNSIHEEPNEGTQACDACS